MTTLTFDTLTYVKKLRAVGVTEEQAEVQAEAIKELIAEQLATKQDINDLRRDIKEMELRVKADIIKWVAAMLVAQAGLIAGLIVGLFKLFK